MGKRRERPKPTEEREAGERRRDNLIQVGVDPDTWTDFEEWRVERELSPSEAARRLIRNGLEEQETETATTTDRAIILVLLGGFGVLAILTGDPQPVVYPVTALLLAAGLILWVKDS